jgi:hypothetical protein
MYGSNVVVFKNITTFQYSINSVEGIILRRPELVGALE